MNKKYMLAVLLTSLVLVGLLLVVFYFGIRYDSWNMLSTLEKTPQDKNVPSLPNSITTQEVHSTIIPLPEREKLTLDNPKKVITENAPLPKTQTFSIGEVLKTGNVEILFSDVVYDGRCPEEVDCLVAGEAVVELALRIGVQNYKIYLTTIRGGKPDYWVGWDFKESYSPEVLEQIKNAQVIAKNTTYLQGTEYRSSRAVAAGYTFHLESLTPNRKLGDTKTDTAPQVIPKEKYRATIVVDKQ